MNNNITNPSKELWIMRSGEGVRVGNMTDAHVINTYLMVSRNCDAYWTEVFRLEIAKRGITDEQIEAQRKENNTKRRYIVLVCCEREMSVLAICDTYDEAFAVMKEDFVKTLNLTEEELAECSTDDGERFLDENMAYANESNNYDWKIVEITEPKEK